VEPIRVVFPAGQKIKTLAPDEPDPDVPKVSVEPTRAQFEELGHVQTVLIAYRNALKRLLTGRLAAFRDLVPKHLNSPCDLFIAGFADGYLVRQELAPTRDVPEQCHIGLTWLDLPIERALPMLSDNVIHVAGSPIAPSDGARFQIVQYDPVTHQPEGVVAAAQMILETTITEGLDPSRPERLVSASNAIEVSGALELVDPASGKSVARSYEIPFGKRLPVGWETIDVYKRSMPPDMFCRDDPTEDWAERDILMAVASRHLRAERFKVFDQIAANRQAASMLLSEFENALKGPEEQIHQFLREHPELIVPTYKETWSKLRLGNSLVTDLVVRDATDRYVFVELERASHRLFRADGQQAEPLTHAVNQVMDWFRYIEDNVDTLRREDSLDGLTATPDGLVVIGRSGDLSRDDERKLKTMRTTQPRIAVLTYDQLLQSARSAFTNLFGALNLASPKVNLRTALTEVTDAGAGVAGGDTRAAHG
jgi:hypothetical protein